MHTEIEKLIKLAISDGFVTDKERDAILRKAKILGEDPDEVEMILDGELALAKKQQTINLGSTDKTTKKVTIINTFTLPTKKESLIKLLIFSYSNYESIQDIV